MKCSTAEMASSPDELLAFSSGVQANSHLALAHYLLAALAFAFYGSQVCPFLEILSAFHLIVPITLAYPIRIWLMTYVERIPVERRVSRQFQLDFGLFMTAGLALVLYNYGLYQSPWHSNAKVMFGTAFLGLFVAIDLALERERCEIIRLDKRGAINSNKRLKPLSMTRKLSLVASLVIISVTGIMFLVFNKDLYWILETRNLTASQVRLTVLAEALFILTLAMGYSLRIIYAYTRNLKLFFARQNCVLQAVADGDLSRQVPVMRHDEFGLMAVGTNKMIRNLKRSRQELKRTRDATIYSLATLAETRDNETGQHILRTQHYVKTLALQLRENGKHVPQLDDDYIETLYKSAPLHDIGKVGIPDHILKKPGKLNDDEFKIMQQHARLGAEALATAASTLGENSYLHAAQEIAGSHHEKWDGSGYPQGLSGDKIPLSARIMALADVYDALRSKRVYKEAFSPVQTHNIITQGSGKHFDPDIVQAFITCEPEFERISDKYQD